MSCCFVTLLVSPIQGAITLKQFNNIDGTRLSDLTNHVRFTGGFDQLAWPAAFEAPVDSGDNYGIQMQGLLTVPATGDYIFYLCSDDEGALFLSTDESEVNKRLIAMEPEWNGSRQWVRTDRRPNRENISAPIHLEAGRKYYIEALMKEAGGGDNLGVAWRKPGDPEPQDGDAPIPGEFLSPFPLPLATINPPAPPERLEVETLLFSRLFWTASTSADVGGYLVERSVDGGPWEALSFVKETVHVDRDVAPGRQYRYRVATINRVGETGAPSVVTGSTGISMLVREMEDYNYGGGQFPGYAHSPSAVEAPSVSTLAPGFDYFYQFADSAFPPNPYRPDSMIVVDEDPAPDTSRHIIAWTSKGDWWRYTFDVPSAGWVRLVLKAATPGVSNIQLFWDEEPVTTFTCHTGDWNRYDQFESDQPFWSEAGRHTLRLQMADSAANLDQFGIEFGGAPPARRLIFQEPFEAYTDSGALGLYGGWSIVNGSGQPAVAWNIQNARTESRTGSFTGMSGGFVMTDSGEDPRARVDESLLSPAIDCRGYARVRLRFTQNAHFHRQNDSRQQCDVELDVFDESAGQWAGNWVRVSHRERIDGNATDILELPIGAWADGRKIRIRWRFHEAKWDYWWAIDNVQLTGERSDPPIAPAVSRLTINNGNASTTDRRVVLTSVVEGNPTQMMASENADFAGAEWQPYASHVQVTLSSAHGVRTVYFKVRNTLGASGAVSAQIVHSPPGPALNAVRTLRPASIFATGTLEIAVEVSYRGGDPISAIELEESLPVGWVFDSIARGPAPATVPPGNKTGSVLFRWDAPPQFPFLFVYKVRLAGEASKQGSVSGQVRIRTPAGVILQAVSGVEKPTEIRGDSMFHRVLYHGTVLSNEEWDWIAAAGYTLVHSYGGDPNFLRQMMDEAHARGVKMIPGSSGGSQVAWMRLSLDSTAPGAPASLRFDVRHHYSEPHPSIVFFATPGHPLHMLRIPLENPAWTTLGALAAHLNTLGHGISASVEPGKEGMSSSFLATWQYSDLAGGTQTVFGSELPNSYRHYVDVVKDHPALFCFVPFDDVDLVYFSPNFQRYVLDQLREWAPGVPVYLLPRGDLPGTFQHDHKVAYRAYDGYITYTYPGVLPDHVDIIRSLTQDWWAFQVHEDPKPWLLLGRAFFSADTIPPKGALIEQWETAVRAGVPLTGFGFYAWQHDGGQYALAGLRELQEEAREVNRRIEQTYFDVRIDQDIRRVEAETATVRFKARIFGGKPPFVAEWDFGDGQKGFGEEVAHRYTHAGSYPVTVTVLGANGLTSTRTTHAHLLGQLSPSLTEDFQDGVAQNFVNRDGDWIVSQGVLAPAQVPTGLTWSYLGGAGSSSYSVAADLSFQKPGGEAVILWSGANTNSPSRLTWSIPQDPDFTLRGTSLLQLHTDTGVAKAHLPFDSSRTYRVVVDVLSSAVLVSVNGRLILEQSISQARGDGVVGFGADQTLVGWDNVAWSPVNAFQVRPALASAEPKAAPYVVQFSPGQRGGRPPFTYDWDFADGARSSSSDPQHEFAGPGAWNVKLAVTDADGKVAAGSLWVLTGASTLYREAEDYDWTDGASPGFPIRAEFGVRYGAGQRGRKGIDFRQQTSGEGDQIQFRDDGAVSLESGTSDTGIHIRSAGAIDWWNYSFQFPSTGLARIRAYWTADNPPRAAVCRLSWNGKFISDLIFPASNPAVFSAVLSPVFPVDGSLAQIQFHPLDWGLSFSRFEIDFVPGIDTDGDGIVDMADLDADNDGFLNSDETTGGQSSPLDSGSRPSDTDDDRLSDRNDSDDDNDGVLDDLDSAPLIANRAPEVAGVADQIIRANEQLRLEISALDLDLPPQNLAFNLEGEVPAGASVDGNGVFTWTPTPEQASRTYDFSVAVRDDGTPPRTTVRAFSVEVGEALLRGFERVAITTENGPVTLVVPRKHYDFVAQNRTLYLATEGNDANPGTLELPWNTFAHALSQLEPGDVLYVRGGAYAEPFEMKRSGTLARPIVISAFPEERVRITQPDGWQKANPQRSTVTLQHCAFVWLHGFEVEGGWRPGTPHESGGDRSCIFVGGGSADGVRVLNNICSRGYDQGIRTWWSNGGYLIEGNVIFECGAPWAGRGIALDVGDGNTAPVIVRGNVVLNCGGGLDLNYARGVAAYNNAILGTITTGTTISMAPGNIVAHNVWHRSIASGLGIGGQSLTNVIVNNIFSANSPAHLLMNDYWGPIDGVTLGNTLDYSVFDPRSDLASPPEWFSPWLGTHVIHADPLFLDPERYDFRLQPNSPARNAAGSLKLPGALPSPDIGLFAATHYWQPDLAPVEDVTINEGENVRVPLTLAVSNPDIASVRFEWVDPPPAGLNLDAATGLITWTTGEAHGPGAYTLRVLAIADASPFLTSHSEVKVIVNEVNSPPVIAGTIPEQTVTEGETVNLELNTADIGNTPGLLRELFSNIPGTALADLENAARFPNQPTSSTIRRSGFEMPRDAADNYGQRLRGFIIPPETGAYTFWIAGDDASALFLSTSVLPDQKRRIASVEAWTDFRQWTKEPNQKSEPIFLEAGKPYYIEALMKEGGGGDHLSVRWQLPGGVFETPIPFSRLFAWVRQPVVFVRDEDSPTQRLVFSLGEGAPAGASIDPSSGRFTWTPSEAQGPGTNVITVRVTDEGSPPLRVESSFQVIVRESNSAPTLAEIADQTVDEETTLSLSLVGQDTDLPSNHLTYRLVQGPLNALLDAASGEFQWTPSETQGSGAHDVTIEVSDDASPPLTARQSFRISVNEVNLAPVFAGVADQTIPEEAEFASSTTATDPDVPANGISYRLLEGPEGARLDTQTGRFTWRPSEAQGPGTNRIAIVATDTGSPPLSVTNTFAIVVAEVNDAPVLTPIPQQTIAPGASLTLTLTAADADMPANTLRFELIDGPVGLTVDGASGILNWIPGVDQRPGTNTVSVKVADDGIPPLSGSATFQIVSEASASIQLVKASLTADGQFSFSWSARPGASYQVQFISSVQSSQWQDLGPVLVAEAEVLVFTEPGAGLAQRFYRVVHP